jgi:hypothetical protein
MRRISSLRAPVGLLLLTWIVGCAPGDLLGPDALQGIEGLVTIGPQCPVVQQDGSCPDLPYQAWVRVRRSDGALVARIRSGEDGKFRVGLRPGAYRLDPESGSPFPFATGENVEVERGVFSEVVIQFDTGIR